MSSKSLCKSILEYGNYEDKLIYFPQWADGEDISKVQDTGFKLPGIPEGFKVMFAGAVGEAHGFECNMQAHCLPRSIKILSG